MRTMATVTWPPAWSLRTPDFAWVYPEALVVFPLIPGLPRAAQGFFCWRGGIASC